MEEKNKSPRPTGDENQFSQLIGFGVTSTSGEGNNYYLEAYTNTDNNSDRTLKKIKSRPSLLIPAEHQSDIIVKINPHLPYKENIEFIEMALKNIQENKPTLTMNELIKANPEKEEDTTIETFDTLINKHRAETIADMFFIYDCATYILDDAKKYNAPLEEQLLDSTIDEYDKKEIRENISPYTTAKKIISSNEYGNELSRQLGNKSKKTIEDYYNKIHNLIENNSYKSLI